ncbi:MAG TPA: peptidylprolyl isomerase [Pontiellaceae bacterium]|nr:peptidylprolyl isomerase [Pontiellaceae bacterium]HPR83331.1 peptidylprolyl isomerase [Pontiellaceae bacterium]
MKNNLKALCGVFAAAFLLVGCSRAEVEAKVENTPEPAKETKVMILMKTTKGDIKLELDAAKAPKTVANFLKYVESGHYKDTIFHRVISNFMIQGGGMTANMNQKKAPYTVENEANNGLKNVRGSIAMARTSDPHSAGAQFFINVVDNGFLDFKAPTQQGWGYCVFGKVVEGMDVVDAIRAVPTAPGDVPRETVTITEVSVIK